ncbi:PDC sensor domain-containing protein [Vibrio lentus]
MNRKIQIYLFFSMIISFLLILGVAGLGMYSQFKDDVLHQNTLEFERQKSDLTRLYENKFKLMRGLNLSPDNFEASLDLATDAWSIQGERLSLVDLEGNIISFDAGDFNAIDKNREWFLDIKSGSKQFSSKIYPSATSNKFVKTLSIPWVSEGEVLGVVAHDLDGSELVIPGTFILTDSDFRVVSTFDSDLTNDWGGGTCLH